MAEKPCIKATVVGNCFPYSRCCHAKCVLPTTAGWISDIM